MSEIEELKEGLKKALEAHDGWLCHYYGSQLMHRQEMERKSRERRFAHARHMIELKHSCATNTIHKMIQWSISTLVKDSILKSLYTELDEEEKRYQKEITDLKQNNM